MKQVEKEQKLYAGLQDGFYAFSFSEELGGRGVLNLSRLEELQKKIKPDLVRKISYYITDLNEQRRGKGWPGKLDAHQFVINKVNNITYLIIVVAREVQPTAYMIYLEGVWELEEEDLLNE